MTGQQRLTIRAELARRMGYSVVQSPYEEFRFYRLVSPNGERSGLCESETEAWSLAPDPFTNAADKDALVEWLDKESRPGGVIKNGLMVRDEFINHLLQVHGLSKYEVDDFFAAMTASHEAITLAAAKALGVQEAESD